MPPVPLFILLNILDLIGTYFILQSGGHEVMPVAQFFLQGGFIYLVLFKISAVLGIIGLLKKFERPSIFAYLNIGMFAVVALPLANFLFTLWYLSPRLH